MTRGIAAVLILACATSHADTLADLFEAAVESDPARASSEAQFHASQARVTQARAPLLPNLGVTGSASTSAFEPYGGTASVTNYHSGQWQVQITQPLYRPGLTAGLSEAQAQRASSQAQLDAADEDLLVRLMSAYFDALAAREVWQSLKRQKAATQQQFAAAKRGFEVGTGSLTDVSNAAAKHDLVIGQEGAAQNDLILKREALQQMIGSAALVLRVLPRGAHGPQPSALTLSWLLDQAREQSPSVQQARLALEAAKLEVKKASRDHYPTLDLALSYGSTQTTGTSTTPIPVHGKTAQAQVNLNLPLFSGFGVVGKEREAVALEEKARADLLGAERAVSTNVREAYYGEHSALDQITALETAEKSTEAAMQQNQKGYLVGTSSSTDVLNAESQYFQAYRDLMKAKLDAWLNHIKLQIAVGYPWRDGVDAFDRLLEQEPVETDSPQLTYEPHGGESLQNQELIIPIAGHPAGG